MPRRTNLFQQVVTILNEHAAGDAVVEESAMLANGVTGEKREVDVLIRSSVAGYEVMIGVEGTAAGRNAGSPWVESMLKKHENLPTSKLVLVSEAGFSKPGRELAEAEGALALSPKDLDPDDPALAVLRGLPSLWPKQVALTPRRCKVVVLADEAPELVEDNPDELLLHTLAGEPIGTVSAYFATVFDSRFAELAQMIGLPDIEEDIDAPFTFGSAFAVGPTAEEPPMFLRRDADGALHLVLEITLNGDAQIRVGEIPLHHGRLGEVTYAYGEGEVDSARVVLVASESDSGPRATLRLDDGTSVPLRLSEPSMSDPAERDAGLADSG